MVAKDPKAKSPVSKADVLKMLDELIKLTIIDEESPQSFRVRAYENARRAVEGAQDDLLAQPASELVKVDGLGKSTVQKILEFAETGTVEKLEKLKAEYPPGFARLAQIPGIGPKTLKMMRKKLQIENLDDLKKAIEKKQIRELPRMGPASETKIASAIERLGLSGKDNRRPVADVMPIAKQLVAEIRDMEGVLTADYCGSLRRMSETIGDIDITITAHEPSPIFEALQNHKIVDSIVAAGPKKLSFLTEEGLQVDVRVVAEEALGAAQLYFTGSKAHNIELRQLAIDKGLLLNEYGLFRDNEPLAGANEAEIYQALEISYVPPPLREGKGEIQHASTSDFSDLVSLSDIKGDLHYHTDRSGDGRSSLEDMVAVAADKGHQYLAITDHGEDLAINGSTREEMIAHQARIAETQENYEMSILYGCELNIGPSGGLDYDAEFRSLFEYTVASVHSHFDQSPSEQTKRLTNAIEDTTVNSIGHLTGRYIGRRPGIEFDVPKVLDALADNDVALEINGSLHRLDAGADVVRQAVEREVKIVINTDSHHTSELGRMEYGVLTAQRGWVPAELVVNTWEEDKFLKWVDSRS